METKTFLIVLSGHEMNHSYLIKGNNLLDALEKACKERGDFEWCIESKMDTQAVYDWLKNSDGAESTMVFEIQGTINEMTL